MTPATLPSVETVRTPTAAPVRKKSRRKYWVTGALLLVVGLGVAAGVINHRRGKLTPVTTEKAVIKTITQLVSATGKIQPEKEVKIAPEVSGEIIELPFREGAPVNKGDLLVRIKPDNYRFQVEQRAADLASVRAANLDSKSRLLKAEDDLKRSEDLYAKQLISDSEYTAAKTAQEVAKANYESSLANIVRMEGSLNQARDQLAKTEIYSPIDGTLSLRITEVGERVAGTGQYGGAEIMRVADLANMEVRVNINENDIVNVKAGDRARVTIDAFPNRKFTGEVKEIGTTAKTTGQGTQEEVTNFQVKIRILDKDVTFRPGMSANADIETKTVENVVAVPIQYVTVSTRTDSKTVEELTADREKKAANTQGEGAANAVNQKQQREQERADRENLNRVVFLRSGGTVKMQKVETGIQDTTHIEIKSGVKAGDEVVSGSF
ncbi:MAG: efflux transporter periplasmic adaptor subunit, partial [Verrucomicrobia bacterium RIFCSPLOWO2_12_FULL_64_8]